MEHQAIVHLSGARSLGPVGPVPCKVGSVTGVVGAAGGLGGFVPPLVMGSVYVALRSYARGLVLSAVVG
ncbi:hypothetical protein ACFY1L_28545 [Streptomyces sp. NPDC001663]|uniref:hypothetical protein n=1 Tax=Streptomyces sp. NPDC001663 TaxID=3364597 RepID=UPI00368598BF